MANEPFDDKAIDRDAYEQAEAQLRLIRDRMPEDAIEALAREVVRRLAFRMPRAVAPDHLPTDEEIEALCQALLSDSEAAGDRIILAARRDGVPIEVIHLSYVAAAARKLGELWDQDKISFAQVTVASSRLYRIIRGLKRVLMPTDKRIRSAGAVAISLVPDETHTIGIEIASDLFVRAGWDVELLIGMKIDEIIAAIEKRPFDAVMIVAQTDRSVADLLSLSVAIKIAQPAARLVLAGNVIDHVEDIDVMVGADAVIDSLEHAVDDLSEIIKEVDRAKN